MEYSIEPARMWGFYTVHGGIEPGGRFFVSALSKLQREIRTGYGTLPYPGAAGLGSTPEGQLSPNTPHPEHPPISDRVSGTGGSTPRGAVSTSRNSFSVLVLEL